jgi:Short C-terminal domain
MIRRRLMAPRRGRPGLLGTMARTAVVAGTATVTANAISGRAQNRQQQAAAAQQAAYDQQQQVASLQQQVDSQQAAAPTPAQPAGDLMSELEKLASMKAAGVLTDPEFAAAKAKLLAA